MSDTPQTPAEMGRKGGKANGEAKRRSAAHYRRLSKLGIAARWKNKTPQDGGEKKVAEQPKINS